MEHLGAMQTAAKLNAGAARACTHTISVAHGTFCTHYDCTACRFAREGSERVSECVDWFEEDEMGTNVRLLSEVLVGAAQLTPTAHKHLRLGRHAHVLWYCSRK